MMRHKNDLYGKDPEVGNETTDLLQHENNDDDSTNSLPSRPCAYRWFLLVSGLAVLASGVMIFAQIATLSSLKGLYVQILLRFYIMAFCAMFIFAELRLRIFLCLAPSFNNWFYRGFLYSFVGLIGVEMSKATLVEGSAGLSAHTKSLLLKTAAYSMFSMGLLYMLMGLLCLQCLSEKVKQAYDKELDKAIEAKSAGQKSH